MIINLQPPQISTMWPLFKAALISANGIPEELQDSYLNYALENVLSGKFQCWVIFNYAEGSEEREVYAIGVTYLEEDTLFKCTSLVLHTLYGLRTMPDNFALDTFNKFVEYARVNKCVSIKAESNHPRLIELMSMVGMERDKRYTLDLIRR